MPRIDAAAASRPSGGPPRDEDVTAVDPGGPGVTVAMNATAAALLVRLMHELGTEDPMAVLTRALGMLEQGLAARREGRRLGVYDAATQRFMDLVI
jgi:hypothetical protein